MTARQEARVGSRATGGDAWSYQTQRAPNVGEILQTARERKGVDLARAERETKIRARHLMALESGDFADLPAQVYAKGFLRNYSTYLGLDADEVLARWRREIDQPRSAETVKVKPPPQPIAAPNRGFKLTTGLIVALILAAIVVAFVGYVGLQLVRFTQNPEITLNGPSVRQLQPGATRVLLSGYGTPGAEVTATGPDDLVQRTTASSRGSWSLDLKVSTGRNDFAIVTSDLETARDSAPLQVIATVPLAAGFAGDPQLAPALPDGSEGASLSGTPSAELALTSPRKGLLTKNGKVKVQGSSDADNVLVSFQWRGREANAKVAPAPRELAVEDGVFRGTFQLPRGPWQVSVSAAVGGGTPAVTSIPIKSQFDKIVLTVTAVGKGTRFRLSDEQDDVIVQGVRLDPGQSRTFKLDGPVTLRVANAKAAIITVDGVEYGPLSDRPEAKTWQIQQGQKPKTIS
ncbi:MAG: helix-turn-helix domain-containing protein [Chloroflexota bacterium]